MAVLGNCYVCGVQVGHRACEIPVCNKCSGKDERDRKERERWMALSVDERLDELKARLDGLPMESIWANVPIG